MIEGFLIGLLTGIALGTVSGLVPGVHANTVASLLLGVQGALIAFFGPHTVAISMFAALITHTFIDIIPSTFLGIPDADTAISVLPAHALCIEGHGQEAVRISALGSAGAVAASMPVFAIFFCLLPEVQPYIDWWIGIILLFVAGLLIVYSDSPGWSLAVFSVSGLLGAFTFHFSYLAWHLCGSSSLLMPLLSGLFGISVLLTSSHGRMPRQEFDGIGMDGRALAKHTGLGTLAGAVVGWLPGLSNATANAVLSLGVDYGSERRGYIAATSAANTANAFLGLAALFALGRTRNGVMVALASQDLPPLTLLLCTGAAAALIAYLLTVLLSGASHHLEGFDMRRMNRCVIAFIVLLSFVLTGPFGLFILVLATLTGLVPTIVNIRRVACMGAVMLPIMLYSFGLGL